MDIWFPIETERLLLREFSLKLLGQTSLTAEIGYTFNCRYWGNGYATEAARAALTRAIAALHLHRVYAACDTRNAASWRVMEKLGMRREAHFVRDVFQKGSGGSP